MSKTLFSRKKQVFLTPFQKILLFLFVIFIFGIVDAQRDTEHWFAPMSQRGVENKTLHEGLYFSTDSVTPFPVEIYSNNVLIGTVTISKGNPQVFSTLSQSPPYMVAPYTSPGLIFKPVAMGLYTKGAKPYFVTFRFSTYYHAEIVTSKGKAGIGRLFYASPPPLSFLDGAYNFTVGILATEDNTKVTVSGYSPNVKFSNNMVTPSSLNFTLNKGQSYIIEGNGAYPENSKGFIGAKIVANKPISVTNGNFTGEFSFAPSNLGGDIMMDQVVPIDRLGNEFVLVKGNASIDRRMEDAFIVATENNTQVFINNAATPIVTLNEGESYRVNEISNTNYIHQGNIHYNMYIRTTKNVYVYQLLAGGDNVVSGGFNSIPPLNCYLPKKIDEIGSINILPPRSMITNLNIVTETGAAVAVNGVTPTSAQGPYPVSGTSNWVSYTVPDVSGNITITSTRAVTAGILGGSGPAGYGGYFAGFSSIPAISKRDGDCIPGIVLEVEGEYQNYQWYRENVLIPGAVNSTFTPTQSGSYTVRVSSGTCAPIMTTAYKVYTCLVKTMVSEVLCGSSKEITPVFTNSTQSVVPGSVAIVTPPTNGTAAINPTTGIITYNPNSGYQGNETIVYRFCGDNQDFTDCEEVTLNLAVSQTPIVNNAILRSCFIEKNPATALFNLTTASVSDPGFQKKYYPSMTDAQNQTNEILNPTVYIAPNGVVYVRVTNKGCYNIAVVTLIVLPPVQSNILKDKIICVEDKTILDAGPGFTGYEWSTGATTQSISNAGVGMYWVKLKTGICVTKQTVKVYASESPVITDIEISNSTVTVMVIGGTPPYRYSLDNILWQDSNVFTNVTRGNVTVYVKTVIIVLQWH
ncbi:IgGFc-binding protein [Chryseobacterium tructae]|uniref:IgGFc-binding protein n=1 Tax=Chryseobacterium tructae TaxID=1037380 RepID=UPI00338E4603